VITVVFVSGTSDPRYWCSQGLGSPALVVTEAVCLVLTGRSWFWLGLQPLTSGSVAFTVLLTLALALALTVGLDSGA